MIIYTVTVKKIIKPKFNNHISTCIYNAKTFEIQKLHKLFRRSLKLFVMYGSGLSITSSELRIYTEMG